MLRYQPIIWWYVQSQSTNESVVMNASVLWMFCVFEFEFELGACVCVTRLNRLGPMNRSMALMNEYFIIVMNGIVSIVICVLKHNWKPSIELKLFNGKKTLISHNPRPHKNHTCHALLSKLHTHKKKCPLMIERMKEVKKVVPIACVGAAQIGRLYSLNSGSFRS